MYSLITFLLPPAQSQQNSNKTPPNTDKGEDINDVLPHHPLNPRAGDKAPSPRPPERARQLNLQILGNEAEPQSSESQWDRRRRWLRFSIAAHAKTLTNFILENREP